MYPEDVDESGKTSRTYSLDSSSVKEIDGACGYEGSHSDEEQQNRSPPQTAEQLGRQKGGEEEDLLGDASELEALLNAGKEELLKTSVLSLKHLSNEKIVSLMQLISEIGGDSLHGRQLPKLAVLYSTAPGLRLWSKLLSRVKTFVSIRAVSTPRSQFLRMITMSRGRVQRGGGTEMSEAVAEVLAGRYLPHLHHLALPACHIPTIVRALISGRVSTLQHLELQGPSDPAQFSSTRHLRRLFMSGLVEGLQYLGLSHCMEEEEMEGLAAALDSGKLTCLRHLDLSGNFFQGPFGSRGLANLMSCRALVGLENLSLHNCGISDEGMQAFASAVMARGPWKLRFLNVGSNDIGDVGFAWLLRLVKADRLPHLQELHLLYNYRIGDESKTEAAKLLEIGHVPHLQLLYLSSHIVSERVAESFLRAYKNNTGLLVELPNVLWPNEQIERGVAGFRERNLGLLFSAPKSMHLQKSISP